MIFRKKGRLAAAGLLCLCLAALAGCAPYRVDKPSTAPQTNSVIDAPRAARGNPPFYEVYGRRYYVLDSSRGYRERGIASWYGRDFDGRRTSGGERYDMNAMTAAHKTLPIPTWVEVTNLKNGKRVIVKVNDRGPFVGDRIIDLSYRAARELDMIGSGTARVEVRALGTPAAEAAAPERVAASASSPAVPARTAPPPRRRSSDGRAGFSIINEAVADTPSPRDRPMRQIYVQVGAFSDKQNAVRLTAKLKRNGFNDAFVYSATVDGDRVLHRVRIGPLRNEEQFDRVNLGLRSIGVENSRLVIEN
jgi:rare lipoprotein A